MSIAKQNLCPEYLERQRQYLREGHSIPDLSSKISLVARKRRKKTVGDVKSIGALLKKARRAIKKNLAKQKRRLRSKTASTTADLPDGVLLGKTVRVIKDMWCPL